MFHFRHRFYSDKCLLPERSPRKERLPTEPHLSRPPRPLCNSGGDFNFVENPVLDKIEGRDRVGASSRTPLALITTNSQLKDVFRSLNPNTKSCTYFSHSSNVQSRLDRFYISNNLCTQVTRLRHIAVPRCDHRGCGFNIRMSVKNRGRGYWKCNVSVLQDRHLRDDLLALID